MTLTQSHHLPSGSTRKLEELKQRWVAAGKPAEPEWDALLKDL